MSGLELPDEKILRQVVRRIGRADYPAWTTALAAAGYCTNPVRLVGVQTRTNPATGEITHRYSSAEEPDRVLLKACNNRRATRCPACAAVYQGDARALVLAGLVGGKGLSETVAERPVIFTTLTAPSYGTVHTTHQPPGPCQPARARRCPHRPPCRVVHDPDDPEVGTPICDGCYDWVGTIIFNATATELWRRTMIATRRSLAGLLRLRVREIDAYQTLAYVKVVEYQTRGVIHYHALLRADPATAASPVDVDMLATAFRVAATRTNAPNPAQPDQPIRWGPQVDITPIPTGPDRARLAGYLAKYTTKSVDTSGILDRPLRHPDLTDTTLPHHLQTLAGVAWDLADQPALAQLNLRHWAHTLGYRGHWLTKSRSWSTTLTNIRGDRHAHQLQAHGHDPDDTVTGEWQYHGNGHTNPGDTWLAHHAHRRRQADRRTAWEER